MINNKGQNYTHEHSLFTHPLEWEWNVLAELIKYHQFYTLIMVGNLLID